MHDLVVRGGTVVDGTGAIARTADVAVDDGRISEVGDLGGAAARRVIEADGLLVTPGWVDIHTHFDGQATWDDVLAPSAWHGVTSVVMGNCGVGFAPARPDRHDWLIGLMEGVEDIPGTALAEGMTWGWETFGEYLDALDRRSWTIDVGTQVAHGAVRAYVMGERGATQRAGHARRHRRDEGAWSRRPMRAGALGLLHLADHRPPGHRRRARAGHLRRRGRAVRHRRGAGRAGHRRVRAGPDGLGRRGHHRPGQGGRLDAPALGRHRPAGHLRPAPGRRRPGPVARAHGRVAHGPPTRAPTCGRRWPDGPPACSRGTTPPTRCST